MHNADTHNDCTRLLQVVTHDHEYAMVISNGFFSHRNLLLDHIAMAFYCVSLHANLVFIVVQFIWRFKFLSKDAMYACALLTLREYACCLAWDHPKKVYNGFALVRYFSSFRGLWHKRLQHASAHF